MCIWHVYMHAYMDVIRHLYMPDAQANTALHEAAAAGMAGACASLVAAGAVFTGVCTKVRTADFPLVPLS